MWFSFPVMNAIAIELIPGEHYQLATLPENEQEAGVIYLGNRIVKLVSIRSDGTAFVDSDSPTGQPFRVSQSRLFNF